MAQPITVDSIIKRRDDLIEASLGDELVMMSVDQGKYYALNSVATRIWQRLTEPTPVAALCAEFLAEFEVSAEQCAADVVQFVSHLQAQGLVHVVA